MFEIIRDPTITPKQLAYCYKELQAKEDKLVRNKKLFHEQLLSLQRDSKIGIMSETRADDDREKGIEELRLKIKDIITEHEDLVDEMGEIRTRMAALIPQTAKKRLDEIRKIESHTHARKRGELIHEFLSVLAKALVIKEKLHGRLDSNYNLEFKFNALSDKDKKFFVNEIDRIREEMINNNEKNKENLSEIGDEKIELEKIIAGEPFAQVDILLKEVGAKVTKT